ncbi:DNA-binding protein with MIZ/SP-RING zinc finger isoform 1 [Tanacetum coccineum]
MARFRIQELKDVLSHLSLPKTGKKQDLTDRILALLSSGEDQKDKSIQKEDVVTLINDIYRKMMSTGANVPVIRGRGLPDSSSITPKEEIVDQTCADRQCNVVQHIPCVIIPVNSTDGASPASPLHYCETCRINRCDPFWKTLAHPLYPVKLRVSSTPVDGFHFSSPPQLKTETSFLITRANVHMLEKGGYDVQFIKFSPSLEQAWCILLNDSVPFRMQWPQYSDLHVNDMFARTISRPGSKMLGANGRDESPSISMYVQEGLNKICLTGSDTRTFCLGVRLVKQRTFQEVISLIPGEKEGESFNEAVSRVCRCIGGGMAAANDDSDSDLEVIADNITINLRCPWQCPICLKNYSLEDIIIDPYLNRIAKMMQHCDEDVTEIEVKSDGSWRAKIGRPFMDLERWHLSDGSLCEFDSNMDVLAKASGHQLAMRANGVPDIGLPQGNKLDVYVTDCGQEIISMSSSSSEDTREDDFQSVDNFTHKDSLMDCTPYSNYLQTSVVTNRSSSSSLGEPCVIVLSDSDEENDDVVSAAGVSTPCPPPNGSTSSLTATLDTPDLHLGDAAYPAASTRLSGEAESSQMSDNNGLSVCLTFAGQPKTLTEGVKADFGQMGNKKRPLGDPFTFPHCFLYCIDQVHCIRWLLLQASQMAKSMKLVQHILSI